MHALTVLVAAASVETASDRLAEELGALSVSVEDADAGTAAEQPVFDEPGLTLPARWQRARLTALFAAQESAVAAAAGLAAGAERACIESIAPVDERDWVRMTQSQFGPIEIDADFWIVPTWSSVPAAARTVIHLDPGMAFGTGTHPTTRMCLRWISRAAATRRRPWNRVLDYGCGSGVLSIAAALFGAAAVDAVDIDAAALVATAANASANRVRVNAAGPQDVGGGYALIVANILATPLRLLAPLLSRRLAAGGELVLSGILERQAEELRDAYGPWLELDVADVDDGWILMTGRRPASERMA